MASIKRTGITDKGKDLITREIAGITELIFTKISVSSNKLADTVNLETLINIDEVKQTVNVSKVEKIGTSQIKVTATFNNSGLMNGYSMETLGIYAKDTAGTEVLFAVTVAGTSDYMPATNGINLSTVTVELIFNLSNTDNVSLSVDTAALVTVGMFDSFKSKVLENRVKYTDLAEENKAGIITYAKIKEIAPKPDLSPYIKFENSAWNPWSGRNGTSNSESLIKGSYSESWGPGNHHMYRLKKFNDIEAYATLHVGTDRMYYKHSNRNNNNFLYFVDNIDIAARDSRMDAFDTNILNVRNLLQDVINWHIRDIRLAGYVAGIIYHQNVGHERAGYVVTGVVQNTGDQIVDIIQMRALQFFRNGQWLNTPFA